MQQEKTDGKTKTSAIVFRVLGAVCMAAIFYFSSRPADISQEQSGFVLRMLRAIFGSGALTDFIVRKCAHFCEFACLGFLLSGANLTPKNKKMRIPTAVIFSSAYALTDELHQIFVAGRSCRAADWALDTAGAAVGAALFFALILLRRRKQKNN